MKNKIILTIIVLIGLVSNIYPQQKFRKAAYLTQSVGTHIYNHAGASTNVQAELTAYNTAHGYTGENACTINLDPTSPDDYPPGGNQIWKWWDAFNDASGFTFKEDYLETSTYPVIMIKHCFAAQSAIWFWWYEGPQDTINYPQTQSDYNYQWYVRKILNVMERYPEKYFVWWDMPPALSNAGSAADMQRLADFNLWMTDTLQAGLDSYGAFPPNVKIFDYFNLLDSANFMPVSLADGPTDSHPNAHASEIVAPILVQRMFDAAIAYESALRIKSNVNTRIFMQGPFSGGSMLTALNTNNFIPDHQPYNISPWNYNGSEFVSPGFFSTHPDMVDWVLLELRTGTESSTIVGRRAAFLKSDGSIVDIDGTSQVKFEYLIEGNYYLVICYRNHLAVMSANLISLSSTSSQLYDFSIAQTQAYGTNAMKDLGGGFFGMITADTDGSGTVNASDRSNTWNQRNLSGYYGTDVDLSGTVNAADRSATWNNRNISTQVP